VQPMEVNSGQNIVDFKRSNVKFGEYFDFAARDKRVDMKLSRDINEILLQHLQRNYSRSIPSVLCHQIARASLFNRSKFVVRVEEYVGIEEATNAHGPRRD